MKDKGQHLFIKIHTSNTLFLCKELKLQWCVRDRQKQEQTKTDFCRTITSSSLDHSTMCYFQDPTWHFCFSEGDSLLEAAEGYCPQLSALTNLKLALTLALTDPNCLQLTYSICIYYFIMPTTSVTASTYLHRCVSD